MRPLEISKIPEGTQSVNPPHTHREKDNNEKTLETDISMGLCCPVLTFSMLVSCFRTLAVSCVSDFDFKTAKARKFFDSLDDVQLVLTAGRCASLPVQTAGQCVACADSWTMCSLCRQLDNV